MNKYLLMALITFLSTGGLSAQTASSGKKILVAYYSWGGNTREMATQIARATGADLFEIVPEIPYSTDYDTCVEQAKKEINANYKPALKTKPGDIGQYGVIFVGSPCWWATVAPPVATFLSDSDFSGKTIVPFMTHEGSRMGRTVEEIKKLCPESTLLKALPIRGSAVKNSNAEVLSWLREIGMIN